MATIAPFCAIRYNPGRLGHDVSRLIAPPYDVLDKAKKQALLARNDRNIVAIDLPHTPPRQAGPDRLYEQAGRRLQAWLAEGTLKQDDRPAIYLYQQRFQHRGQSYTRRMVLLRLRLEEFGRGSVFGHEQTFGGPKQDRLKLMQATRCNLSAVFGLFSDPNGQALSGLEPTGRKPDMSGRLEGVENLLWVLPEPSAMAGLQQRLAERNIYIADGHHRYATALMYRDWLARREGPLPAEHPANFVLTAVCRMEDAGLLILPTHRVVKAAARIDPGQLQRAVRGYFEPADAPASDPQQLAEALNDLEPGSVAIVRPGGRPMVLRLVRRDVLDSLEPQRSQAWRRLGLAIVQRFLIEQVIAPRLAGAELEVLYSPDAGEAARLAEAADGLAVLVQPTGMDQLRAVCEAGELMPPKSTYFYPKLATGLVINPLF
ncbi:MAG: DUF1015 domain-containing protein [Phycisphaerae bacterium]